MQHIMAIIIPLGSETVAQEAGIIVLVLEDQMDMASWFDLSGDTLS